MYKQANLQRANAKVLSFRNNDKNGLFYKGPEINNLGPTKESYLE